MPARRRDFDAIVRHRIDLQRYAKREASVVLRLMAETDSETARMLRDRLPNLKAGDIRAARAKALIKSVKEQRREGIAHVYGAFRRDVIDLAKAEAETVGRMMAATVRAPVSFNPIDAARMRAAVLDTPMAGGRTAASTLSQFFGDMAVGDQRRLLGAIQLGISRDQTTDTMVKTIVGTRANGYTDGVMAITRREATQAVRTVVNHVANSAQLEWAMANRDVCIGLEISNILDERTCDECRDLDGKFYPTTDAPAPDGMETTDKIPPIHRQDRCATVPVFDLERLATKMPDRMEV